MLFNSIDFALFLPIVFVLYWFVVNRNLKAQNGLVLIASYFFYGWWDWRFLFLIAFSSFVDFFIGMKLGKSENDTQRKWLLATSIFVNIGFLGFFKYFNFFSESLTNAFSFMGQPIDNPFLLNVILPVGISFYTFQTLSYSIDVYKRKLEPTNDIFAFLAFVSFFPQLVAGPIERATNLLPQFYKKRVFEYEKAADGMRQILWGLFKKVVIADNCAAYANDIFNNSADYSGSTLFLGAVFFAFQIYGDFSGYSDIAIGTSRLFGFNLMQNFAFPYFSRDIAEFWRRWHISLSTWFRDYIYIPLGGSRGGTWMKVRNTFIIFIVSGFWHGANWTFVAWGALNAIYFLPIMLLERNRLNTDTIAAGKWLPNFKEIYQVGATFFFTCIAWVFFRADSTLHAVQYISTIFSRSLLSVPEVFPKKILLLIVIFLAVEWIQREKPHGLFIESNNSGGLANLSGYKGVRWATYCGIAFVILFWGGSQQEFIYFQF